MSILIFMLASAILLSLTTRGSIVHTVVITNQKGGVGKSTIGALFAWWLKEKGRARVAALDLDSQKNLTRTLSEASLRGYCRTLVWA